MEIYSSLMGDNLAELVLQSPYPQDDCAGHEHGTELFLKRGRNAGTWKTVVIFSPSMESV